MAEPSSMDALNSQAFWNDFMRRPDAKAAYQSEKLLAEKKQRWAEERRAIEERGVRRRIVVDALETAPADLKKLVAPMFHIRVVEQFLWMLYDECNQKGTNFHAKLRDEQSMAHLRKLREAFQDGGEARMEELEDQWYSICNNIAEDQEKKQEEERGPMNIDIHTLKNVLEFGQECKREGNNKFKEGSYEEALFIYSQGDDVMKKWKVEKHLKNEHQWLKDYHLACLKNKAQAALKLELWVTALKSADAALRIDSEDHKACYRKALALKGLGRFKEAEDSLCRLEEIAQGCADKSDILRDCEAERQRLKVARAKHKKSTQDMLAKAFDAGIFSVDRDNQEPPPVSALQHEAATQVKDEVQRRLAAVPSQRPLERNVQLTAALAGDLMDELSESYEQSWYQERVRKCARDSGFDKSVFLMRLKDIAFEAQKPVLVKWGFDGSPQGVREMTAAIQEHTGERMPTWLGEKRERCLELLYGGREGGMAQILK